MTRAGGPRTQAERDATTVETGFAVVTGAALAGLAFLAVFALPLDTGTRMLVAKYAVGAVFVARVAYVLLRWRRNAGERQPSQPGRTRPDS